MPALYITLGILGGLLLLLILFYLIATKPRLSRKKDIRHFATYKYAHRGLHGDGVAENSLTAFRLAAEAGFGIELDVRLTKDGEAVVFHDATLDRVTALSGKVIDFESTELKKVKLSDTEDTIPLLSEVLSLVAGRVPILVELKEEPGNRGVAKVALEILSGYGGEYIIESFNPLTLGDIRKANPDILTGILSTNYLKEEKYRKPLYFAVQTFLTNILCRPDFVSFNAAESRLLCFRLFRRLFGVCSFAWTVTSKEDENAAFSHRFDTVIFEGYNTENRNGKKDEI